MRYSSEVLVAATTCLGFASAFLPGPKIHKPGYDRAMQVNKRQLPAEPTGVQSLVTPAGINITYKDPGAEGVCETTPGVKSYAGFVNLAEDVHSFVSIHHSSVSVTQSGLTRRIVLVLREQKRSRHRPSYSLAQRWPWQ